MLRLAAVCLAFALAACDTAPAASSSALRLDPADLDALSQDPAALIGVWDWLGSVYYDTADGQPAVVTPESSGQARRIEFTADVVRVYEGDELVLETAYSVARRTYGNGTQEARPSIRYERGGYGEDFGIDDDWLVLDSTPVDGPQSQYRRR